MRAKLTFALQLNTVILDKSEESDYAFDVEFQAGMDFEMKTQTQRKKLKVSSTNQQPNRLGFKNKFDIPKFAGRCNDWVQ